MKVRLLCLIMCFVGALQAQVNLVPNGSFEDTLECIDFSNQINRIKFWSTPTSSTPDVFTSEYCNIYLNSNIIDVPSNYWGYQFARTGNNYAGLVLYTNSQEGVNREYIQVKLKNKLIQNRQYCVKYYVNLSDNINYYAIKNFSAYFSVDSTYIQGTGPNAPILNFNTQVSVNQLLNDTTSWNEISGNFIASGDEQYMIIGNFKAQDEVDTIQFNPYSNYRIAYYHIDDVSLFECDSITGIEENQSNKINIYPNPASDNITINTGSLQDWEIELFDIAGRKLIQQKITDDNATIDVSGMANGVYICVINSKGKTLKREKIIVSR